MTDSSFLFEQRSGPFVRDIYRFLELDSTNAKLKAWIRSREAKHGSVVRTDYQTTGRGQMGTTWQSEPGQNLLLSLYLQNLPLPIDQQFALNMTVCLALQQFFAQRLSDVQIKWPNDLYAQGKKLGGLLIENFIGKHWDGCIIGMGLNINQVRFEHLPQAASVRSLSLKTWPLYEAEAQLFQCLDENLSQAYSSQFAEVERRFNEHLLGQNEWLWYQNTQGECFQARVIHVNAQGQMEMQTLQGQTLYPGIKSLRLMGHTQP